MVADTNKDDKIPEKVSTSKDEIGTIIIPI
jgi:hypothetical protein